MENHCCHFSEIWWKLMKFAKNHKKVCFHELWFIDGEPVDNNKDGTFTVYLDENKNNEPGKEL